MLVKVIELVGSSKKSWEDAAQEALREAARSLRNIQSIDVVKNSARVDGEGEICEYRTTVHVAFAVEHHSQLLGTGAETAQAT